MKPTDRAAMCGHMMTALIESVDKYEQAMEGPCQFGFTVAGKRGKRVLFNCSECGEWVGLMANYCSKCGARVRGDES